MAVVSSQGLLGCDVV